MIKRISAAQGLSHPWLTEERPYPTAAALMPTFKSRDGQD